VLIRECQCRPDTLLALAASRPQDFPILLDSAAAGALSRWSILAAFPAEALLADAGDPAPFLVALAARLATTRRGNGNAGSAAADSDELPFTGGWFVYLGYEVAGEVEPTLQLPPSPDRLRAGALRIPAALLWDAKTGRGYALAETPPTLDQLQLAVRTAQPLTGSAAVPVTLSEDAPAAYVSAVQRAQHYIRAGDVYQANLSRGWRAPWPPHSSSPAATQALTAALYQSLRAANPAPFAAWAQLPGLQILCSSPERLVCVRHGVIETRPIAGTRPRVPRGDAPAEIAAMLASPKERAEHTMLIDLERNDLGRVAVGGSVEVAEFMVTESYAHVHHIVSSVRGRLRAGVQPLEVLRAVFPGGTITGCPKVRCMQIIAELEAGGRGAYTGSLGYINDDGSMDFNILIRTLTIGGGVLQFRAGAGIVADSDATLELAETRAKALGLLRAFGGAGAVS
jgi:anthranilate synthase component I